MTRTSLRNVFIGSTVAVLAVFLYMTYLSYLAFPERTHPEDIPAEGAGGKVVWERHACIDCHTLLGEGAYYAPELANVMERRGEPFVRAVLESASREGWGTTRRMPRFDLSGKDIDSLVAFFKWMGRVNTSNWPP